MADLRLPPELLARLQSSEPKKTYEIPNLETTKAFFCLLSAELEVPIILVGSAATERDVLAVQRKAENKKLVPNDFDVMIDTYDREKFRSTAQVLREFAKKFQFKIDILPTSFIGNRPYIIFREGKITAARTS